MSSKFPYCCVEFLGHCCGVKKRKSKDQSGVRFSSSNISIVGSDLVTDGFRTPTNNNVKKKMSGSQEKSGGSYVRSVFARKSSNSSSIANRQQHQQQQSKSSKDLHPPYPYDSENRMNGRLSGGGGGGFQDKIFDGLTKIFLDSLESFVFVFCPVGKARRKEKDSGPVAQGNDEGKLYLENALLDRHLNETDLRRLVWMPNGLEENEWMASHTISLFEHVNLLYGTISEFCNSTSCPDMTGPCMRTYLWFDEKGKKVKVAAPQYIDYVMTFIQKTINDESIFPTKSTNAFPSSFKPIVKKIFRLLFHVIAHIYHSHFKEIVLLCLHAHLNCVFAHYTIFNESFKLVDEKETEILQDLSLAMKIRDNPPSEDETMTDSNKENINADPDAKLSSCQTSYTPDGSDSIVTSGGSNSFNPSDVDDPLLIKEPALVNAGASDS